MPADPTYDPRVWGSCDFRRCKAPATEVVIISFRLDRQGNRRSRPLSVCYECWQMFEVVPPFHDAPRDVPASTREDELDDRW